MGVSSAIWPHPSGMEGIPGGIRWTLAACSLFSWFIGTSSQLPTPIMAPSSKASNHVRRCTRPARYRSLPVAQKYPLAIKDGRLYTSKVIDSICMGDHHGTPVVAQLGSTEIDMATYFNKNYRLREASRHTSIVLAPLHLARLLVVWMRGFE
ncbi:hypothetical protein DFH09DRAFT_462066 [Mycena vulgaris]|nr:hypothetical protein DFH09DRAFT_462066 [Mycena vulgaris]